MKVGNSTVRQIAPGLTIVEMDETAMRAAIVERYARWEAAARAARKARRERVEAARRMFMGEPCK